MTTRHREDYYQILGVERTASRAKIKSAYRVLAQRYHPDVNPGDSEAEARFKEINAAYGALSDVEQRRKYDAFLAVTSQPLPEARKPLIRRQSRSGAIKIRLDVQIGGISLTLGDEVRADLKRALGELARAIERSIPD
jgi:DnaJ-class molecular chaperone